VEEFWTLGAWMVCEGGKACGFAARTTCVDAEANSMKRMADCSEMARAISKRGSGLRAIAAKSYILIHVCRCDCGVNQRGVRG